jgi:hypothetical protein
MDTLFGTVLFPESLEHQRRLDERVQLIDGHHPDELLVAIDDKIVASVEFTSPKMVVRDLTGALIGFFDGPPSVVKEAVLGYCHRHQ